MGNYTGDYRQIDPNDLTSLPEVDREGFRSFLDGVHASAEYFLKNVLSAKGYSPENIISWKIGEKTVFLSDGKKFVWGSGNIWELGE